jgi:hypothetical protein
MGRIRIGGNKLKNKANKISIDDKKSATNKTDDLNLNDEFVDQDVKQNKSINKLGRVQFKATKKLTKHETTSTFTKVYFF